MYDFRMKSEIVSLIKVIARIGIFVDRHKALLDEYVEAFADHVTLVELEQSILKLLLVIELEEGGVLCASLAVPFSNIVAMERVFLVGEFVVVAVLKQIEQGGGTVVAIADLEVVLP